jgi:hypothetical protein
MESRTVKTLTFSQVYVRMKLIHMQPQTNNIPLRGICHHHHCDVTNQKGLIRDSSITTVGREWRKDSQDNNEDM